MGREKRRHFGQIFNVFIEGAAGLAEIGITDEGKRNADRMAGVSFVVLLVAHATHKFSGRIFHACVDREWTAL